jgi:hypothetical protein
MNDDYLWNKTGEPDPEVQELEEILGTLRYQPKELVLPVDIAVPRRHSHLPLLAIAATVALAVLAAGLWYSLKSVNKPTSQTASKIDVTPVPAPTAPRKVNEPQLANTNDAPAAPRKKRLTRRYPASDPTVVARKKREREEAMAAKEQLLIALRLASEKLGQAQRKTQSPAVPNQIRNQHRVG